jgi:hypothetical protein
VEPHFRLPFFHWLPPWRLRIVMSRACGYFEKQPDLGRATSAVQSAVLVDQQQMQFLFPDARIVSERVLGLTKVPHGDPVTGSAHAFVLLDAGRW